MTLKTLYISDMDGTLLNMDKEVSPWSASIINAFIAGGGHFTVATARSAASCVKILSGINIDVPVVLMNGAVIFDLRGERYVKKEIIPAEPAHSIISIVKQYDIAGFMYAVRDGKLITYYENLENKAMKEFHDERVQKYYKRFEQVTALEEMTLENNVIYISLIDDYDKLCHVHECLKNRSRGNLESKLPLDIGMAFYRDNYGDRPWYLEIFGAGASKYNAARYLRELGHYDRIIGFGDNFNDIPLLKACDEFYCVSNAVDELKQLSTGVIGSHIEEAVAGFIAERESVRV